MKLLATDLDGTFLGGTDEHRQQLYRYLRKQPDITLVFVTGRSLASVKTLLEDPAIPTPDYIIGDVGATIVNGWSLQPVMPVQSPIAARWPGADEVRGRLRGIPGLVYQEVPQERRCSFLLQQPLLVPEIKALLAEWDCEVIYSAGKFLDVLPSGVNKGTSLTELVSLLHMDHADVLVAGDTLNDLGMYCCGFKSVIVGNGEPDLLSATAALPDVYRAAAYGAGGILEAMRHFSLSDIKTGVEIVNQ